MEAAESKMEVEPAAVSVDMMEHEDEDGDHDPGIQQVVGNDAQETVVCVGHTTITCFGSGSASEFSPILAKAFLPAPPAPPALPLHPTSVFAASASAFFPVAGG